MLAEISRPWSKGSRLADEITDWFQLSRPRFETVAVKQINPMYIKYKCAKQTANVKHCKALIGLHSTGPSQAKEATEQLYDISYTHKTVTHWPIKSLHPTAKRDLVPAAMTPQEMILAAARFKHCPEG